MEEHDEDPLWRLDARIAPDGSLHVEPEFSDGCDLVDAAAATSFAALVAEAIEVHPERGRLLELVPIPIRLRRMVNVDVDEPARWQFFTVDGVGDTVSIATFAAADVYPHVAAAARRLEAAATLDEDAS